jgi:L-serine dehydratase
MGLVCDPIAGLVEYPCNLRNASGVINALISADLALAEVQSLIPFDEVVEAMYKVGKSLPESLRETAQGGIADTPTGRKLSDEVIK